ncbi:putative DNA ligase-like protein [compost metagenome]
MVFDVLYINGEWIHDLPLLARQEQLNEIIIPSERVQLVPSVSYAQSDSLLTIMKDKGWEGIVCKETNSTYSFGGKDGRWQKIKLGYDLYAAIGGVTIKQGRYNAILLGLYNEQGQFIYIGHVGSGMIKNAQWQELIRHLLTLTTTKMPFINMPERTKGALWIEPMVSVKVKYMEWTSHYTLRQPVLQAITDKPAYECVTTQT